MCRRPQGFRVVATREGGVDRNADGTHNAQNLLQSPPARVAWIETFRRRCLLRCSALSPPARVAWIETGIYIIAQPRRCVATREGGVDRNFTERFNLPVVLAVATREGGVDRNSAASPALFAVLSSPPARVAWIETPPANTYHNISGVATREGGVDRNTVRSSVLS